MIGGASLALAGASGFMAATAIGVGAQAPARTVTINVGTGAQGPAGDPGPPGPPGPPGDPGAESCPTGSTFSAVVINNGGERTTLYACVKD